MAHPIPGWLVPVAGTVGGSGVVAALVSHLLTRGRQKRKDAFDETVELQSATHDVLQTYINRLGAVEIKADQQESRLDHQKARLDEQDEKISALSAQVEMLTSDKARLEGEKAMLLQQIGILQAQLEESERVGFATKVENEALELQIVALKAQVKTNDAQMATILTRLENVTTLKQVGEIKHELEGNK